MSSLLNFEKAKFGVLYVKTAAARKEVPTSLLEEAWASLEVTKTVPGESLVEVNAAFEELYSNYFAKEVGWDKILQQVKAKVNCEIEALRAREEKSVEIMARWRDDKKMLSHKIASLKTKLFKALSKEGNGNKSQGQDNGGMDWLDLDPPQFWSSVFQGSFASFARILRAPASDPLGSHKPKKAWGLPSYP
ncbi:hypothetical protein DSO57_1036604 [Entomophthora muscae]|uniref:Uncharacterized protein n=1 Tax=Entomophthora muscae TaxID=34485 RepID=A0ACC2TA62_9FUNG|nr:hypothetical protein DSO57_1036604 [Entomophthora muscae]